MATGPRYRVKLRRRREGKTNYYKRRDMLKSGAIRVVIRRSSKNMRVQFVKALPNGDVTQADAISNSLGEFGWAITGGNVPAAYLTGYLAGKKALAAGIDYAILDLGLQSNTRGSRIYAALKGVIDAGVEVPASEEIFPEESALKGEHIAHIADSYDKNELKKVFASYNKNKVKTDELPKVVDKVVSTIDKKF